LVYKCKKKRGFSHIETVMGVNIENAAKGLGEAGADIIGSNCGNGIENMVKIAEKAKNLISLGVSIIGGCCGTTPEHIRQLRKVVT